MAQSHRSKKTKDTDWCPCFLGRVTDLDAQQNTERLYFQELWLFSLIQLNRFVIGSHNILQYIHLCKIVGIRNVDLSHHT